MDPPASKRAAKNTTVFRAKHARNGTLFRSQIMDNVNNNSFSDVRVVL